MLSDNLGKINQRICEASERSGRSSDEVLLLAVSKTFPVEVIQEAIDAGVDQFGENRIQEGIIKVPALPSSLTWHLIGHLQKNKVRKALPLFDVIHSVDSLAMAEQINRIAGEEGIEQQRVLVQVNVAEDPAKFGFMKSEALEYFEALLEMEHLKIEGLMTIPAFDPEPEKTRPAFAKLRELRDELSEKTGNPLPQLSMGMSHDFEVAIEEGATIIRVGTALFGKRDYPAGK